MREIQREKWWRAGILMNGAFKCKGNISCDWICFCGPSTLSSASSNSNVTTFEQRCEYKQKSMTLLKTLKNPYVLPYVWVNSRSIISTRKNDGWKYILKYIFFNAEYPALVHLTLWIQNFWKKIIIGGLFMTPPQNTLQCTTVHCNVL